MSDKTDCKTLKPVYHTQTDTQPADPKDIKGKNNLFRINEEVQLGQGQEIFQNRKNCNNKQLKYKRIRNF